MADIFEGTLEYPGLREKHKLKLKYFLIQKTIFCQNSKLFLSKPGTSASNILKIVIILSKGFQRKKVKTINFTFLFEQYD